MKEMDVPSLELLSNGVLIPTEELIIAIHEKVIKYRKEVGREDTAAIRNPGVIRNLYDTLIDRMHKYKKDPHENAIYVATETFYHIACEHPFHDGNKSTAYITAILILTANDIWERIGAINLDTGYIVDPIVSLDAPEEAKEITKLAEAGRDEAEVKKLIKEFLEKTIGAKR
jgi:prophage maintenance system killer protein